LHLDLAGVDILMKDISESWLNTDAYICEVNAQPQLGSLTSKHIYSIILQEYIQNDGKIPIILVLGSRPGNNTYKSIINHLIQKKVSVGYTLNDIVFIGNDQQTNNSLSFYDRGKLLISNKNVTSICLELNETESIYNGLPFDSFDYLIIDENHLNKEKTVQENLRDYKEILKIICPACDKKILLSPGINLKIQGLQKITKALFKPIPVKDFKSLIYEMGLYD
jgi:cyanophycin synthetase